MKRESKHMVIMMVLALIFAPMLTVFACPCSSYCSTCDRDDQPCSSQAHANETLRAAAHANGCCSGGDSTRTEEPEHAGRDNISDAPCVCSCAIGSVPYENVIPGAQSPVSETLRLMTVETLTTTSGVDLLVSTGVNVYVGHSPPKSSLSPHIVHCCFLC